MNALERRAVQRVVNQATVVGVPVPAEVAGFLCHGERGSAAARAWAEQHPDDDTICCNGSVEYGPGGCECWAPVFDVDQAAPCPPADPHDLPVRDSMCGDCAYRPGSPERCDPLLVDELLELPDTGAPFYCHDGLRRPVSWIHPDGRTIDGHPADYQPPIVAGVPYRADGQPAALCGGWAAIAYRRQRSGSKATQG